MVKFSGPFRDTHATDIIRAAAMIEMRFINSALCKILVMSDLCFLDQQRYSIDLAAFSTSHEAELFGGGGLYGNP